MFKPKRSSQSEYEFISIDELAPDDYLLRSIDKYIDFSFLMGGAQGKGKVKSLI